RAAAVLVDPAARAPGRRDHVAHRARAVALDERIASALRRTRFDPVETSIAGVDRAEADRVGHDQRGSDRRSPRTVRRDAPRHDSDRRDVALPGQSPAGAARERTMAVARIDSLAYGPHGVARINGKVHFIRQVAPGDEVEVEVDEDHRAYAYGHATRL